MKALSVVDTAAMFLVGCGILVRVIPGPHGCIHHLQEMAGAVSWLVPLLINLVGEIVAGSPGAAGGIRCVEIAWRGGAATH